MDTVVPYMGYLVIKPPDASTLIDGISACVCTSNDVDVRPERECYAILLSRNSAEFCDSQVFLRLYPIAL